MQVVDPSHQFRRVDALDIQVVHQTALAATPLALDDAHYRAAVGVGNPNTELIEKLRAAGVDVSVCGQAVAEHHYSYDWIGKHVTLTLSALTTITTLQHQGYSLVPM